MTSLAVQAYNLVTGDVTNIATQIEQFRFTTLAPGGYGDFSCKLKISNARVQAQRPELALFAHVAVMDGLFPAFLGRWDEVAIVLDKSEGDLVELHALGASHCTTDDPQDVSYSGKTTMYIVNDQMTSSTLKRNATLPLDSDQSLVLPNQPAGTFNDAFNGKTFEDVLNEILAMLGDYVWCVWGHPTHTDAAGFPTWQMLVHVRDTSTIKYTAYLVDEFAHDIRPSVEYAYSVITVKYKDSTTLAPASVTVTDSRLNANGSQGTCPIPWRRLEKDLSHLQLSSAQASTMGNALLADYKNGGAKITIEMGAVRDAQGNPIPLWQVRADSVINLPELAPLAPQLPTTAGAYSWGAGGTLFYIQDTEYNESSGSAPTLTLHCNSFNDTASFQIQRLQAMIEKYFSRERKHHTPIQASGEVLTGSFSFQVNPTANNEVFVMNVQFSPTVTTAPSSVTISVTTATNVTGGTAGDLTITGFSISFTVTSSAAAGIIKGTWQTVGN